MLLLSLDCTFGGHSAAICDNDAIIASAHHPRIHATDGLMSTLDRIMRSARLNLSDLDGIAFGAGPGLFSGIRAACASAQGIAYAANLRTVAVCSMHALAQACAAKRALVAYPAQQGHCYLACYRQQSSQWRSTYPPQLHALASLPKIKGDWHLCGRKLGPLVPKLQRAVVGKIESKQSWRGNLAVAIAKIGVEQWNRATAAAKAKPAYVRTKVAYTKAELALSKRA